MLAAEYSPDILSDVKLPNPELWEVHRIKISLHRAKTGYSYPTIRLPHRFSALAGLPTQIYQTVHEGTLAFLVVISPKEKAAKRLLNRSGVFLASGALACVPSP